MENIKNSLNNVKNKMNNTSLKKKILITIIILFVIIIIVKLFQYFFEKKKKDSVFLLNGTKKASNRMIVKHKNENEILMKRSNDEDLVIEFSYTFWIYIEDWSYKYGEWKHIMHKGNENSWPERSPGIWLHPVENKMRIYMNTFQKTVDFIDIDNIPINKWFHVSVCTHQRSMDIFINSKLKYSHKFSSLPKQNNGDVYINSFRGFSGYLSNIQYHPKYLSYDTLNSILLKGPNKMPCVESGELPPYFSDDWFNKEISEINNL